MQVWFGVVLALRKNLGLCMLRLYLLAPRVRLTPVTKPWPAAFSQTPVPQERGKHTTWVLRGRAPQRSPPTLERRPKPVKWTSGRGEDEIGGGPEIRSSWEALLGSLERHPEDPLRPQRGGTLLSCVAVGKARVCRPPRSNSTRTGIRTREYFYVTIS